MALSHYTADSVLETLFQLNILQFLVSNETVQDLPDELTTTYLDGLLPGLVAKYGDNQPVKVNMKATKAPTSLFQKDRIEVIVTLELTFIVNDETAIVVTLIDLDSEVSVNLQNALLTVQLKEV